MGVRHAVVVPRANPRVRNLVLAGAFPPPALAAIPIAFAGRRIVAPALCFCKTGLLAELLSGVMIGTAVAVGVGAVKSAAFKWRWRRRRHHADVRAQDDVSIVPMVPNVP